MAPGKMRGPTPYFIFSEEQRQAVREELVEKQKQQRQREREEADPEEEAGGSGSSPAAPP